MLEGMSELFAYKAMIKNLVKREIRGKYKGSALGFLWNFLTPLVQIAVYLIVFSAIFRPEINNYAVYLVVGMTLWIYFSETSQNVSHIFIDNSDLLKKIYFPRASLPISVILSKFVNFIIMIGISYAVILITGYQFSIAASLCLLIFIPIFMLFLLGFSLLISSIDVYLRDIEYIITVTMMFLIWLTPVMYLRSQFDSPILNLLLAINPMTYFTETFQTILYWAQIPSLSSMLTCLAIAVVTFILGIYTFNHLEQDFAEVL